VEEKPLSRLYVFIIFIAAAIFSNALTPAFIDLFKSSGRLVKNYKGEMIPQGIGIMFPIYYLLWYAFLKLFNESFMDNALLILFAITTVCFIGFIDDMLGTRDVLGLKGHFKSLLKGRLTTGALKAIVGLLLAFVLSFPLATTFIEVIVNTLIIALFTNFFNLLDLRPGRAIKVYIIIFLALFAALNLTEKTDILLTFVPLLGFVVGYLPYDLKASSMMGDAGSNVLGISVGLLVVLSLSWHIRIAVLAFLIGIHFFTEKYSLTKLIEKNSLLNYLDNLGRS
jgi:UDP-GlcNAc:undecaprenyl-phosphate GlcNAc-1-phosphate transferase